MKLNELTILEYSNLLESKKSVPGGGSALALVLELSCSLCLMVCNFTIEKKGYENVTDRVKNIAEEVKEIKNQAHILIDEDGLAYQMVMDAYKTKDASLISKASIYGCEVPFKLFNLTKKCELLCEEMIKIGNKNLKSDAKIGRDLCKAIYEGCLDNIRCNIDSIIEENIKEKYLNLLK